MLNKRMFEVEMDIMDLKEDVCLGSVKQMDATRVLLSLYNDSVAMNLKGATATVFAVRPSKDIVYQTVDVVVHEDSNVVQIDCKSSIFQEVGLVRLECEIFDDDNYKVTSPNFSIEVVPRLNDLKEDDLIEGDDIDFVKDFLNYVSKSQAMIEEFSDLLLALGADGETMLDNLLETQNIVNSMLPQVNQEANRLDSSIEEARKTQIDFDNSEADRRKAETTRVSNESSRATEESKRVTGENARVSAESIRQTQENQRKSAETDRVNKENERRSAETTRQNSETARNNSETTRASNENARKTSEQSRASEETKRVTNENTRNSNEDTRKSNETERVSSEKSRVEVFADWEEKINAYFELSELWETIEG